MLVDIIVVVIVFGFILIGWRRGFLLSVYSLFSMIIAIVLACILSPIVSSGIEKTGVRDKLETKISAYVETELTDKFGANASVSAEEAADELPLPGLQKMLRKMRLRRFNIFLIASLPDLQNLSAN